MSRDKSQFYRATASKHIRTYTENSKINKRSNNRYKNRMCDSCFQRATMLVKGQLYCADCAEREGITEGQGKDC